MPSEAAAYDLAADISIGLSAIYRLQAAMVSRPIEVVVLWYLLRVDRSMRRVSAEIDRSIEAIPQSEKLARDTAIASAIRGLTSVCDELDTFFRNMERHQHRFTAFTRRRLEAHRQLAIGLADQLEDLRFVQRYEATAPKPEDLETVPWEQVKAELGL